MLRELYEALERLDASQSRARGAARPDLVVDLRDPLGGPGGLAAPTRPGADWVRDDPRW